MPSFIIPKKDKTVCFLSDFWEVNKRLVRIPFPIPKISTVLQEIEGFSYATALGLNMGYYTIRLDPDASKICTIIFPWGKYSYKRLPINHVNATIAKDVVLAYLDYSKVFEIYTDASSKQLGAVITQDNKPIKFFSWKLSDTQHTYSITKIELLSIVETLKEFKRML